MPLIQKHWPQSDSQRGEMALPCGTIFHGCLVMYEPFKSIKPNLANGLEQALQANNLTLSQFERMTAWTLAQIKRHSDFVEDQLEAAMHLRDPSNLLAFLQEQLAQSQHMSQDMAQTLFELSHEFHTELTELVQNHPSLADTPWPAGSELAIALLQQAMQTGQQAWQQAHQAAQASAQLTQQAWAQKPKRKR